MSSPLDAHVPPWLRCCIAVATMCLAFLPAPVARAATQVYVPSDAADTTPPVISVLVPASGATLTGTALVAAMATDDVGVARVEFSIDGAAAASVPFPPYSWTLDSTTVTNAPHTVSARAFDAAGNSAASSVAVTVSNAPVVSSPCGRTAAPPARYDHVVWIWFENKPRSSVIGSSEAPYVSSLASQCGTGTAWLDDVLDTNSEPNYIAATAGANCDDGTLHSSDPGGGRNCSRFDDGPPASSCADVACPGTIQTRSIFEQLQDAGMTWTAWQEGMSANCSTTGTDYAPKHNPALFFSHLRVPGSDTCSANDLPFANTACDGTTCAVADGNRLASALAADTLPSFAFITPNLCNDMHDTCAPYISPVRNGDDWLRTWLPKFTSTPSYRSGKTAIFLMWDEGSLFSDLVPNVVVAPSIRPGTTTAMPMNNIAALGATQDMLGLPRLNCSAGTQGGGGACPIGSTADLRTAFGV